MNNVEEISVLAIVEAQDKATSVFSSIFGSLTGLVDAYKNFGEASALSGKVFEDSMMGLMTTEERAATAALRLQDAETMATEASMRMRTAQLELGEAVEREGFQSAAAADAQLRLREATLANTIASAGLRDAQRDNAAAQAELTAKQELGKASLAATSSTLMGIGATTAVAAGISVDFAAKFQQQTQTLVAGAGVSSTSIDKVRTDILKMSVDTGTSLKDLTEGYFNVNSRLADTTKSTEVVGDAAKLAKVHMADMATVGKALADAMNAYSASGLSATQASNILGVAVEEGGMSFQELSTSLSQVAPVAASLKIPLADVTAALATMSTQGMTTQQASQDLRHAIEKLNSPTAGMIGTWNQLGLTTAQVQKAMAGPGGLEHAMSMIDEAIRSKLGPGGQVVIDTFKKSQDATSSLNMMLKDMDPSAKQLAISLQNGSISAKEYTKAAKDLSGASADQALQFKALFDKSNGFNDALKAGKPGFNDYEQMLKAAYGDQTSLTAALMLGGQHAEKWAKVTKDAAGAAGNANGEIKGWADVQGTLSQKMAETKAALQVAAVTLGTALLPAVTSVVQAITPWIEKISKIMEHHQTLTKLLVAAGLALGTLGLAIKTVTMATEAWEAVQAILNAELWANPIGVIILAIAGAIAAITAMGLAVTYAYNHFKWFHDAVDAVWRGIKTGATATWHALVSAFNGIKEAASWLYNNGILPLWNAFKTAYDGIKTATVDAWNWLKKTWDSISSAVSGAAQAIWDGVVSAFDGIKDFFKKWWPLLLVIFFPFVAVFVALWNHFHEQITGTATAVWNAIKDFFSGIWDWLTNKASKSWKAIKDNVINPVREGWDWLVDKTNSVNNWIAGKWDWLSGKASSAWNSVKDRITGPFNEAYNWVADKMNSLGNVISSGFDWIVNWLSNIGSRFISIGEDIVRGMVNGVSNGWHWLTSKVSDLANSALKAAKDFLGISSPSKLFASEVGKWIPHGVAMGVTQHTQAAIDAVQDMGSALPQAIGVQGAVNIGVNGLNQAGSVYATGLGLSTAGIGGGGGGTTINVNLNQGSLSGVIATDQRAIDALTQQLGYHIATKVLPQSGTRIHS